MKVLSMTIDWTLKGVEIPVADVANLTNQQQNQIGKMIIDGVLGPVQPSTNPAKVPLLHIGALLASLDAGKRGIPQDRIRETLPVMSGGVFVQLVLSELEHGHLQAGRGSPGGIAQLFYQLKSDEGRSLVEGLLPFRVETKRFVCFSDKRVILCDTLAELDGLKFEAPYAVIDTLDIAARMKRFLRGPFFIATVRSLAAA
jgi:hypothetical protein